MLSNIVRLIIYHRPFGILKKRKCTSNMRLLLSNHNDVTRPVMSDVSFSNNHVTRKGNFMKLLFSNRNLNVG